MASNLASTAQQGNKKKSQFIATKWNRFESYKLTYKVHHKAQHGKKKCVSQVR